jgi:predicted phosphodiesterase
VIIFEREINLDKTLKEIIKKIKEVSNLLGIHPSELTQAQFFKHVENITPWQLRRLGGLSGIRRAHFPVVGKDLVQIREQKEIAKYVSELEKKLSEKELFEKQALVAIQDAIKAIKVEKVNIPKLKSNHKKRSMTVELMLSDIHYGKKTKTFNLEVCRKRMRQLTTVLLQEIEDNKKLYNVEKVIVALLGDIIESYTMHGIESTLSCEFGNARQMQAAIESLYKDVLIPVAMTGLQVIVPCVTGNHDRTEHSRTFNDPGLNNMTWVIYNSLKDLCEASGMKNVKFHIPTDSYVLLDIYGNHCLYEHGDNTKSNTKNAFEALINNRSKQLGKVIDFARFGHYHEYACYDRGRIIINESVCGQDSYANVLGHSSTAGQTINYYIETTERPSCFYKSFPVWLE